VRQQIIAPPTLFTVASGAGSENHFSVLLAATIAFPFHKLLGDFFDSGLWCVFLYSGRVKSPGTFSFQPPLAERRDDRAGIFSRQTPAATIRG
jgi:hypothetical protein